MSRHASTIDIDAALARIPRIRRAPLPVRLWYWRHAGLLGAVPAGLVELGTTTHPAAPISIALSVVVSTVLTPELRRWTVARWRCLLLPHVIRRTCADGLLCSPDGRTPFVVWTSPLPRGVRVVLRCPFGMRTRQIEDAVDILRAATRADEVLVVREPGSRIVVVGFRFVPRGHWWDR